ncbi:MAG TPA: ATP-binding cassette domain-containing protein [Gemmatimonadales bacterium]|nr:ATP-binding cassette domain-containing protein [Gemmatimonadales bacterium]
MALLTLTDVSKRFGAVTAVAGVSCTVDRGEVVGFLGPNGAGKSTTMRLITQYLEPDAGRILLDGRPLAELGRAAKRRIGYLPENNPLYGDMLVAEYLDFVADLRELAGPARRAAFDEAVAATGIADVFYRPIGELSKGYRQRVGLAQAILHRPDLLVLDEPTEGLDPNQRAEIRRLIAELGRDRTVLLSTHVLGEVEHTCSRLLIISRGRLVADGSAASLLSLAAGAVQIRVEIAGGGVLETLRQLPGVRAVEPGPPAADGRVAATLTAAAQPDLRPEIYRLARQRDWTLYELHQEGGSLEDLFRQLTAGEAT